MKMILLRVTRLQHDDDTRTFWTCQILHIRRSLVPSLVRGDLIEPVFDMSNSTNPTWEKNFNSKWLLCSDVLDVSSLSPLQLISMDRSNIRIWDAWLAYLDHDWVKWLEIST